jgi:hypothetical protein
MGIYFRHKWDTKSQQKFNRDFRAYKIGLEFERRKTVGKKEFSNPNAWSKNLVNTYQFRINLLVFRIIIECSKGAMILTKYK